MNVERIPLTSKNQTGKKMHWLIKNFCRDLQKIAVDGVRLSNLSLKQFFTIIKDIHYEMDEAPIEIVMRPIYLFSAEKGDCKKKAIAISSYLKLKKIPYRLIASSSRKDKKIHHVFPQAKMNGEWVNVDATYPQYSIGQQKKLTKYEVLQ